jgi:molybdopterin converting factor small subunit
MSQTATMPALRLVPNCGAKRTSVPVTVRLFGILAALARERLVVFHLSAGSRVGDVLSELGKRFGRDFFERIVRRPGELQSCCALFVNGEQVDDLNIEIKNSGGTTEIGVILFMASEGG